VWLVEVRFALCEIVELAPVPLIEKDDVGAVPVGPAEGVVALNVYEKLALAVVDTFAVIGAECV